MERNCTEQENEVDASFDVGTDEEQERQTQPSVESDANDSTNLAIRFKSDIHYAAKLRTADDDAFPSKETKVRPQVYREDSAQEQPTIAGKRKRELSPELSPKFELFHPREEELNAWQLDESASEFVQRLPPSTALVSTYTGIWAENPHRNPRNKLPCPRVDYFKTCGKKLLEQSLNNRHKIWESSATLPKGCLAVKLIQEGKALQQRVFKLARDTYVHPGKWMLLVKKVDVDRVWKQIVDGVIGNQLGCSCKMTTSDRSDECLVCVYTKDFEDTKDVLRVLQGLERIGLVSAAKVIYYKPDAYTYLNLGNGKAAKYVLPPTLYNSRPMLASQKASKLAFMTQEEGFSA
ncbi:uncharacterized protein yc1106_04816 [Curvularia clavata]|uniref:DUF1917-domain-containing protein n=1 Tax=Curvularia clavata TaxID=95742 RepID=A0A9Q9DSC2_CURCL|nr:uncharacterized protein yc1106_04816 [Curvularia clavata]